MTTLMVPLGVSTAIATTAASPVVGLINRINATAGVLAPTLPALSGENIGARLSVEKASDTTNHTITLTCAGADTFVGGATTELIVFPGQIVDLEVVSIAGTKFWKVIGRHLTKGSLDAAYAAVSTDRLAWIVGRNRGRLLENPAALPVGITIPALYGGATEITGTTTFRTCADPSFRFTSCILSDKVPGQAGYDAGTTSYLGRQVDYNGSGDPQPYLVDIMTDTLSQEFLLIVKNTKAFIEVWVDGQKALPVTFAGNTPGTFYRLRITDTVKRPRHIKIRLKGVNIQGQLSLTTDSIWRPTMPLYTGRWGFIGDSYVASAQDSNGRSFINEIADMLAIEPMPSGESGTGYIANNGGTSGATAFGGRAGYYAGQNMDAFVFIGSQNDDSSSASAIQAAATAAYAGIATSFPGIPVIVFGPAFYTATDSPTRDANDTAVLAAAALAPNVIGYHSMKGWITGTGNGSSPQGDGNADLYIATDGVHPTNAGHVYFGQRMAELISADFIKYAGLLPQLTQMGV